MTIADFNSTADRLMALLPTLYRIEDATPTAADGYLRTLLGLIGEQVTELEGDLEQLYDDLFIETCAPWVIPYIGELVGVQPARELDGQAFTTRSQVANVIAFRRRKGTTDVVEELAVAITGWTARVVEMFAFVATNQNLNHRRNEATTMSLRSARELELVGTSFDPFVHTVDIRWIRSGSGRYNTQNLAVFLWPQVELRLEAVDAQVVDATRYRFHPLGIDMTLVTRPVGDSRIARAATLAEVPWPISRRLLDHNLTTAPVTAPLYGAEMSLVVGTAEGVVDANDIVVCDLRDASGGGWENVADIDAAQVGVDPQHGRIVLGANFNPPVTVSFGQSLTGPIGGGFAREVDFDIDDPATLVVRTDGTGDHVTVAAALAAAAGSGIVAIADSRTYAAALSATVDAGATLSIVAADGFRPTIHLSGALDIVCDDGASVELNGLLISGGPVVITGRPDRVTIRHCTLVPGHELGPNLEPLRPNAASLIIDCDDAVTPEVEVSSSIIGPIQAPRMATVRVSDSIVVGGDHADGSPQTQLVAVSSDLTTMPALGAGPNRLLVIVTRHDPVVVDLGTPVDADAVASVIEAAGTVQDLRASVLDGRIIVAAAEDLSIRHGDANDTTATDLGFTSDSSRKVVIGALRSGPLVFDSPAPRVGLRDGVRSPVQIELGVVPADLDAAAAALQIAIRAAAGDPAFTEALVFTRLNRLVVVPGRSDRHWSFSAVDGDITSVDALGLGATLPAIASDGYGTIGPNLRLERVTVLGSVRANAVELVSDSILRDPLVATRGQQGCVRFSYVAPGSVTPRRYRCLPDHVCSPQLAITSIRYGHPRFGELVPTESMIPVRHGASSGNEMGAFASFQHRLREQSLTFNLDEFMRFSMEAGLLDGRPTTGG